MYCYTQSVPDWKTEKRKTESAEMHRFLQTVSSSLRICVGESIKFTIAQNFKISYEVR